MGKLSKEKSKKIYNIVSTIVVALIFLFLVCVVGVLLVQRFSGNETTVAGYSMFEVLTDSMEPTIMTGDIILSKKVEDVNDLKVGDVITFVAPSGRLAGYNETHRIVEIQLNDDGSIKGIKTAGDNKYGGDSVKVDDWTITDMSSISAKYVKTSKFITGIKNFLGAWYGYVILIAIPLLAVLAILIVNIIKNKQAYDAEVKRVESEKVTLESMSEEDKQKLLFEYLQAKKENEEKKSDDNN